MTDLHNYVFHYNQYTNLWNAIPRDLYNQYWSNRKLKQVLSSKDLDTLLELINRISTDEDFLSKIK
jgi:hypothetical protein